MAKKIVRKESKAVLCKFYDGTFDVDFSEGGVMRGWISQAHLAIPELLDLEDDTKLKVTIIVEYDDGNTV